MLKEDENYKVDWQEEAGCKVKATVTVKKEEVKKAYKQAVKRINKEISLPGFRKGKAPDDVVIQRYASPIEKEWKEIVVNDAFNAALKLSGVYPYNKNTIDKPKIDKCSQEEGAVVSISYERYPHIPEIDFSKLTLPRIEKKKVADSEVDEILKEVQHSQAGYEEVSGRAVQEGDYVDLSIDKIDEEPPHPLVQKRRFEVSAVMVPWLKKLLMTGLNIGESIEGETAADEKASEEEKKNYKPIKVRVMLHGIQKIKLPEIDDELAKKVGATDKNDLITKIRSNLEKDAEAKLKDEKIRTLEALLIEKYPVDLPASILENESRSRAEEKVQELKNQKVPEDQIEAEKEKIEKWAKESAKHGLSLHFLLLEIGEKGKVQLSKEELNEKLNNEILRNPYYHSLVKENSEMLQSLVRRLTTHFQHEKIREYALSQVEN